MTNTLPHFMTYLSYSILLVLFAGVGIGVFRRKKLSKPGRYLHSYLIFALLSELIFRNFGSYTGYNLFMIPIYAALELIILAFFFYFHLLQRSLFVLLTATTGICLITADFFFFSELFDRERYQTLAMVIKDLVLIGYCLQYLYGWLKGTTSEGNWFSMIGVMLVCFTVNLILFASVNFLVNETRSIIIWFWLVNSMVMVLYYSLITYKLW